MPIGTIQSLPNQYTSYARIRDEHGVSYTVHASELPDDVEAGEDVPYYVDIYQHPSGPQTTLRYGSYKGLD